VVDLIVHLTHTLVLACQLLQVLISIHFKRFNAAYWISLFMFVFVQVLANAGRIAHMQLCGKVKFSVEVQINFEFYLTQFRDVYLCPIMYINYRKFALH